MRPLTLVLILASAFLHASWNALLKRQRDPEAASVAILAVAAILAAGTALWAGGAAFPARAGLAWALAAGLCEAGYFVTLAIGLRDAPLGLVYAIARGGALVLVWPISASLLAEPVTAPSIAGALVVMLGLAILGLDASGRASAPGVASAALCAAFVAGYHLAYKCALSAGGDPAAVFAVALAVALPVNLGRLGPGALARVAGSLRANPLILPAAGALCSASFLILLYALARGGAGAVATLRNTSVVIALLLGWAMGERPARGQVAGIVAIALGAVLLGWPP
jgi:drug/metabolite transporter (DMT)-like permease